MSCWRDSVPASIVHGIARMHGVRYHSGVSLQNPQDAQEALANLTQMVKTLALAVEAADLYLNSFDTSAPSRIKATTRAVVEEAMGLLRSRS